MTLFAIVGVRPKPELAEKIEEQFPDRHILVSKDHWVVNGEGTAQSISDGLGIRGGALGSVLVYNLAGYYGYAPTNLWEWMRDNGGEH